MSKILFENVTLINRTNRMLKVTFDGDEYDIPPGENQGFPKVMVGLAKNQNPRWGTQDPYVGSKFESLLAVKGTKDPCTPINMKDEKAVERIDRSQVMGMGRHATSIEGRVFHPSEIREEDGVDEISLGTVFGEGTAKPA